MLDRMVERAREQEIFLREDTPTSGVSSQRFYTTLGCRTAKSSHSLSARESIRQWFHRLKQLFEPDCRERHEVAVDETKIDVDGQPLSVWAAVDCDTLEVLHVDVSPGRSSLDALPFLKELLTRCRGRPLVRADRGPWYDWPLELLDCDAERETWGNRSPIEAWFGLFKYRTRRFWHRVPYRSTADSTRPWLTAFVTLHNATL